MSSKSDHRKKIVIIGGGVFGLSIGWFLARAGRPVTIFERDRVGQGATRAAAGMLMPWKLSKTFSDELFALQQAGYHLWPAFARELSTQTGVDLHYQTDGRYFVALDEKAVNRFRQQYRYHRRIGFEIEWLRGDEARRRLPALGPEIAAAIFTPMAHYVDNRRLVEALREAFLRAGGTLRERTAVQVITVEHNRVGGVRLAAETVAAETVIVAAGAWSGRVGGLPPDLSALVQPLKGQTLTLQMAPNRPLLAQPVIGPVYLVPRPDGRLIVGTTVEEEAGFDITPTAAGLYFILKKAQQIVPAIKELPLVEMSAGLRPTAANRLPLLGATPTAGLLLATGGHSYGILLSPVVAQTISQLVLSGQTAELIKPFGPVVPS